MILSVWFRSRSFFVSGVVFQLFKVGLRCGAPLPILRICFCWYADVAPIAVDSAIASDVIIQHSIHIYK